MPTIGTMFRAVLMVAVGFAAVKGWQLYGPETADVKAMAVRALEAAQTALKDDPAASNETSTLAADPRIAPPAPTPVAPPAASLAPAPPLFAADHVNGSGMTTAPSPPAEAGSPASPLQRAAAPRQDTTNALDAEATPEPQRLTALLAKLEELGGVEPQLTPWGTSGQMYRFCCRAALANVPDHARHFEAVAEAPEAAVEQVLAKVETWRTAQREERALY